MMRIYQVTCALLPGDAIGNHVVLLDRLLKRYSYEAFIYAGFVHACYENIAANAEQLPQLSPDDILLYHFSYGDKLNRLFDRLECKKVLIYHNITPPHFFAPYDYNVVQDLSVGLRDLREVQPNVDYCIAMSEYNKQDLIKAGYEAERIQVMASYLIPFQDYKKEPSWEIMEQYRDGWTNILFVGRIAPHKKQEDVIRAYAWYKKNKNPKSRLILIGSETVPNYTQDLMDYEKKLGVEDVIHPGHISFMDLVAYYRCADVFLCMSEHEGFCIPLIEAMYFGVPVIAYDAAAIKDTLGGAGLLFATKDPALIGTAVDTLMKDAVLRSVMVEGQYARLAEISSTKVEEEWIQSIRSLL